MVGVVAGRVLTKGEWERLKDALPPPGSAASAPLEALGCSSVLRSLLHEFAMESFCHELTLNAPSRKRKRAKGDAAESSDDDDTLAPPESLYLSSYAYGAHARGVVFLMSR